MNEITKHQSTSMVGAGMLPQGLEDMLPEDVMIPRAELLQSNSPKVVDGKEGCKPGTFVNSLTTDVLPSEFVPCLLGNCWIKFNPREPKDPAFNPAFDPGAVIHKTTDPTDPIVIAEGKFGENGELPTITKFINFLCIFPGQTVPLVLSFAKTSHKAGKIFANLIRYKGGAMWDHKYALSSKKEQNEKGVYFTITVAPCGLADDESKLRAKTAYMALKGKDLNIHEDVKAAD